MLREPEARDRAAFIELLASPEVHTYLGGPRPRDELEREMAAVPERWPGSFVVDLDGAMIGQILLRRATEHRRPAAVGKPDLGYLFLPQAGMGRRAVDRPAVPGQTVRVSSAPVTWSPHIGSCGVPSRRHERTSDGANAGPKIGPHSPSSHRLRDGLP